MDIKYSNFDEVINTWNLFSTNERENNLINLINLWNQYIKKSWENKRLKINFIEFNPWIVDNTFVNIDISEIRLKHWITKLYLYLYNSNVDSLKFSDHQNGINEKVIQWDGISKIKKLEFENIHLTSDEKNYLILANLNIDWLYLVRMINLSEKVQSLWCIIQNLIVDASDLWKILFIQNEIKNLYITASSIFKTIFLSNKIWKVHQYIKNIEWYPKTKYKQENRIMANTSRQLKYAFDESKSFLEWDRFYADEMLYTLKSEYFLSPLLFLHLITSIFWTSWFVASVYITGLWFVKLCLTRGLIWLSFNDILIRVINNINPYTNFREISGDMNILQLLYLILLSYWIYQFVLSVRRISKR
ncbi:MAG: hypothetical protein ACD_4C00076G0002 [uncultured bacterium (gcode 4)]|uniref:Uncharacterized protein n=1 Tax=uncultured bacterium (gcode 4) TaxID=1234023 RepID=K2GA74_9BACT|nr:MAG: hypothetical protein ACD_4C00076G0002 [uncultured bacterium (gcode 4)]